MASSGELTGCFLVSLGDLCFLVDGRQCFRCVFFSPVVLVYMWGGGDRQRVLFLWTVEFSVTAARSGEVM